MDKKTMFLIPFMQKLKFLFYLLFTICLSSCEKEELSMNDENGGVFTTKTLIESTKVAATVEASSFGFNANDATQALLAALNSKNDVIIIDKQSSDWVVGPIKVKNLLNKTIIFESGVVIRAKTGAFKSSNDKLFELINAQNVDIRGNGAIFRMNKNEYTNGEWRHGLSLRKCKNVTIDRVTIENSGGDGIYISGYENGSYSEDITLKRVKSLNNKRQGMTLVSVSGIWVRDCEFSNNRGALPEAGIDIEPNSIYDRIVDVTIEKCTITNNGHAGAVLALLNLRSSSVPVSIRFLDCIFSMNHDSTNKYPSSEIVLGADPINPVKGNVSFERCIIEGSKWGLLYSRKTSDAYHASFINCEAKNICQNNSISPIYLEVPDYYTKTLPLGGYTFDNLKLQYSTNLPFLVIQGWKTLPSLKNINGKFIIDAPKNSKPIDFRSYNPSNNINVRLDYSYIN